MKSKRVIGFSVERHRFWSSFYGLLIFLAVFFLVLQFFWIRESPEKVSLKETRAVKIGNQTRLIDVDSSSPQKRPLTNLSEERTFVFLSESEQLKDVLSRANAGVRASYIAKAKGFDLPGGYKPPSFWSKKSNEYSLKSSSFVNTPVSCGFVNREISRIQLRQADVGKISVPVGFEVVTKPFSVDCAGESLDLSLGIPDIFDNVSVVRCVGSVCRPADETNISQSQIVCGGSSISDAREKEILMMQKSVSPAEWGVKLIANKPVVGKSGFVSVGNYFFEFSSAVNKSFAVRVYTPDVNVSAPVNPDFYFAGAPVVLKVGGDVRNVSLRIQVGFPLLEHFDMSSLAFYSEADKKWKYLGGKLVGDIVVFETNDLSSLLSADNSVVFAVMGVLCVSCDVGRLEKIYDGGSRDAIIFIHGLFSGPETWQNSIDDYVLNKQPFQVWALNYPSGQSSFVTAQQFFEQLKLHDKEFDNIYLVAHSFGGFIVHNVLKMASDANASFFGKIRKAVMIGTPHHGTPVLQDYGKFFRYVINSNEGVGLFDVKGVVADELTKGLAGHGVVPIDYYVIAGNKPYSADFGVVKLSAVDFFRFNEENDGVTSVFGAQDMGNIIVNDSCMNFFVVPAVHTDLTGFDQTRRIVSRIISDDLFAKDASLALVGHNKYVRFKISGCLPGEMYVVIGKRISFEQVEAPLNCNCGNNVCGLGENNETCVQDCGK